ncbi:MAG: hypothetical protein ACFB10_08615 [Salibacteraceae bacterium]
MKTSVEISMYPLREAYEGPILAFIERLNRYPDLQVITNTMSTQVFGEYGALMQAITESMGATFEEIPHSIMVMKFINNDLRPTD